MKRWIWTGLLVLGSGWWWLLVKYPAQWNIDPKEFFAYRDQYLTDKINTYQGLSGNKWAVNKYTWLVKEFTDRAAETLDVGSLFFTGDLDTHRSIRTAGAMFVTWLPLILIGVGNCRRRELWGVGGAVIISMVISGFAAQHYFIPAKIPAILGFTYLAAAGIETIGKTWKIKWQAVYGTAILYEMVKFGHELVLHYLPSAPL